MKKAKYSLPFVVIIRTSSNIVNQWKVLPHIYDTNNLSADIAFNFEKRLLKSKMCKIDAYLIFLFPSISCYYATL